jgi:hypothetical protein
MAGYAATSDQRPHRVVPNGMVQRTLDPLQDPMDMSVRYVGRFPSKGLFNSSDHDAGQDNLILEAALASSGADSDAGSADCR